MLHAEEFLAADFTNRTIRKSVKFHVLSGVNLAFDNLSILCNGLLMHFFVLYFIDFWALKIKGICCLMNANFIMVHILWIDKTGQWSITAKWSQQTGDELHFIVISTNFLMPLSFLISSRIQLGCVEVVIQETDSRVIDSIGILINEVNNEVQLLWW